MYDCMITFRSVTPAQRGEGLLRRAGIGCTLSRTPRRMEQQGCGYSLRINAIQIARAVGLLRENRIHFRKVYYIRNDSTMEEMTV